MTSNLFQKLQEYFNEEKILHEEIFDQISFYIYYLFSSKSQSDLYVLAKLLNNHELLRKLARYYAGSKIQMPTGEELFEADILTICFYLKEIRGWNWEQIKTFFPMEYQNFDFSSISFGKKINTIKMQLKADLTKSLKHLDDDTFNKILEEHLDGK